jgi:hypothetical protein
MPRYSLLPRPQNLHRGPHKQPQRGARGEHTPFGCLPRTTHIETIYYLQDLSAPWLVSIPSMSRSLLTCSPVFTWCKALTYSSYVPSQLGNVPWAEDIISPTYLSAPHGVSVCDTDACQVAPRWRRLSSLNWSGTHWQSPEKFDTITLLPFAGDGSWDVQTAPEYGADFFDYAGLEGTAS